MPRRASSGFDIDIPKEATHKQVGLGDIVMTVFGPPKIGKTELASFFDDVLFIATEKGTQFVKTRRLSIDGSDVITAWPQFTAAVPMLEKAKKIRTLCIDTIDGLYQLCFQYVCEKNRVEHPSEAPHGKVWNAVSLEWETWMTRLCNMHKGIIFISHTYERMYNGPEGEQCKISPGLPKTGFNAINELSDFIFYYSYARMKIKSKGKVKRKSVRALYCQPTEDIDAGDRTGLFQPLLRMKKGRAAYDTLNAEFMRVQALLTEAAGGTSE